MSKPDVTKELASGNVSAPARGSAPAPTHQCCRCKNKHTEADRVDVKTGPGAWSSRCPRCNGESYFDLTMEALNDQAHALRPKH